VRAALMWVGAADPVETTKKLRKSDPVLEALRAVMGQWREAFGIFESATTAEAIKEATATEPDQNGPSGKFGLVRPDFRDALMAVAGRGGQISGNSLGKWLQASAGRIVDGYCFERRGERSGVAVWALRLVEEGPAEGKTGGNWE
jgi:putative DNA primase/helicase